MMFLPNCFAASVSSKSESVKVDSIGPNNPVPIPNIALQTKISAIVEEKYGINPPNAEISNPSMDILRNEIFFPTTRPDIIAKGTAVKQDKVAIDATATDEASGKFTEIEAKAGEVALEANTIKFIEQRAIIDCNFLLLIHFSHIFTITKIYTDAHY